MNTLKETSNKNNINYDKNKLKNFDSHKYNPKFTQNE